MHFHDFVWFLQDDTITVRIAFFDFINEFHAAGDFAPHGVLTIERGVTDANAVVYPSVGAKIVSRTVENIGKNDMGGITTIGKYSFSNCADLQMVVLPEGITSLDERAFSNCTHLAHIELPSTLASIGNYCFASCTSGQYMLCRAVTPPTLGTSAISGYIHTNSKLYVPEDSVSAYTNASGWGSFDEIIGF